MNLQVQQYQRMYLDTLKKGIRKLKIMGLVGSGYQRFHDAAQRNNSRLNQIVSEMIQNDIPTNFIGTLPILNKQVELTKLQADYDVNVLRGFN